MLHLSTDTYAYIRRQVIAYTPHKHVHGRACSCTAVVAIEVETENKRSELF